mmetsp:Transcript_17926/g.23197  ORF Transcript_17926/g.23197 Transcript_17926/m.23197 type:complete len:150 (-) Transcript_17926:508-957(-)
MFVIYFRKMRMILIGLMLCLLYASETRAQEQTCFDYPGFADFQSRNCQFYEEEVNPVLLIIWGSPNATYCLAYGSNYPDQNTGLTASEACCVCGGGLPQLPSSMPTIPPSLSPSMSDIPSMMPSNNSERPYSIHSILSLIGGALALIFL